MDHYAKRLLAIEPFHVVDILEKAKALTREGHDIIHMEAGEPDFSTIQPIIEATKTALDRGETKYSNALGLAELRQKISEFYADRYNLKVPKRRIVITPGASGALQLAALLVLNPGEGMLLTDPGYPCNRQFIRLAGGEPQLVPVSAENRYQLSADQVESSWRANTVGALVASPANPTGMVIEQSVLKALHQAVMNKGGRLIVDEIYHGLSFDVDAPTVLGIADDAIVINSFSKMFGMTGWRLGWMVVPDDAVEWIEKLSQNLYISLSTPAQHGALACFEPMALEAFEQRRQIFQQRRDFLLPALRNIGFNIPHDPEGAFYIYANIERFSQDSLSFCRLLLNETGIAITPGCDFGSYQANHHVRFAFTTGMAQLQKGVDRLADFLKSH